MQGATRAQAKGKGRSTDADGRRERDPKPIGEERLWVFAGVSWYFGGGAGGRQTRIDGVVDRCSCPAVEL